ncbi:MAG: hypothetical protein K5894_12975 [Lachnospiraceae bacterium]|nr:hypothetical protein [Lachnospiraceae bacterium]
MVIDWLKETDKYVIHGAQVIAVGAYTAIKELTGIEAECFAVGKPKDKPGYPDNIDDIPMCQIEQISKDKFIVVGVTELIKKVLSFLYENGYKNVYPLTKHEEHLLMSEYR